MNTSEFWQHVGFIQTPLREGCKVQRLEQSDRDLVFATRNKPAMTPSDYAPEQLEQAARESRAWAELSHSHGNLHEAMARTMPTAKGELVARALAKVARLNAQHADAMARLYDEEFERCR